MTHPIIDQLRRLGTDGLQLAWLEVALHNRDRILAMLEAGERLSQQVERVVEPAGFGVHAWRGIRSDIVAALADYREAGK